VSLEAEEEAVATQALFHRGADLEEQAVAGMADIDSQVAAAIQDLRTELMVMAEEPDARLETVLVSSVRMAAPA